MTQVPLPDTLFTTLLIQRNRHSPVGFLFLSAYQWWATGGKKTVETLDCFDAFQGLKKMDWINKCIQFLDIIGLSLSLNEGFPGKFYPTQLAKVGTPGLSGARELNDSCAAVSIQGPTVLFSHVEAFSFSLSTKGRFSGASSPFPFIHPFPSCLSCSCVSNHAPSLTQHLGIPPSLFPGGLSCLMWWPLSPWKSGWRDTTVEKDGLVPVTLVGILVGILAAIGFLCGVVILDWSWTKGYWQ